MTPSDVSVRAGATRQFTATETGASGNPTFAWSANGIGGGNSSIGTISSTGLYTAPATLPNPNTVSVEAVRTADSMMNGTSSVTLLNPVPVISSVTPSQITVGSFSITVSGSEFVNGAAVLFGSTALTTSFVSNGKLTASGTATSSEVGGVAITVRNPDPGSATSGAFNALVVTNSPAVSAEVADRFLEQTTFGPTPALVAQVQQSGLQGFLNAQFVLPTSPYADPAASEMDLGLLQHRFFVQVLNSPDQLRQRVAFALGQIFVIAGDKIDKPEAFTPYLRLLEADAFGNYRQVMKDVTLSPAMGHYLDMVNNDKPDPSRGNHANENYARELMQLFTLGTSLRNQDGSLQLDSSGNPIPTYTQDIVQALARAFTGWTYPTQPGQTPQKHNPTFWNGPMVAVDSNHDTNSKQLLQYSGAAGNGLLPGGQTAEADLEAALDSIFNHPNIAPFVSKQLIEHLVTSNPSPAYVQRIAAVFDNNGSGVRGDLKAVIAAILLDPEARRGDSTATANPNDGHLQEPILYMTGLLRAFSATSDGSGLTTAGGNMGQKALFPGSVFNFFSPSFMIPGTNLVGPEFQILTTATTFNRVNWVNSFVFGSLGSGTTVDFSSYATLASDPNKLLDSLNTLLLHGTMSSNMRNSILTAVSAVPSGNSQAIQQARTAIYLVATSSQYQVQH